jgi:hypothetical protein
MSRIHGLLARVRNLEVGTTSPILRHWRFTGTVRGTHRAGDCGGSHARWTDPSSPAPCAVGLRTPITRTWGTAWWRASGREVTHEDPSANPGPVPYAHRHGCLDRANNRAAFRGRRYRLIRAMILIELAYRLRVRYPGTAQWIWRCVYGPKVPPPPYLTSPSEAWPHERTWATKH